MEEKERVTLVQKKWSHSFILLIICTSLHTLINKVHYVDNVRAVRLIVWFETKLLLRRNSTTCAIECYNYQDFSNRYNLFRFEFLVCAVCIEVSIPHVVHQV